MVDVQQKDHETIGYMCIKCGYKYLENPKFISICYCLDNYKIVQESSWTGLFGEHVTCSKCGKVWKLKEFKEKYRTCISPSDLKRKLEELGWDISFIHSFKIYNENLRE